MNVHFFSLTIGQVFIFEAMSYTKTDEKTGTHVSGDYTVGFKPHDEVAITDMDTVDSLIARGVPKGDICLAEKPLPGKLQGIGLRIHGMWNWCFNQNDINHCLKYNFPNVALGTVIPVTVAPVEVKTSYVFGLEEAEGAALSDMYSSVNKVVEELRHRDPDGYHNQVQIGFELRKQNFHTTTDGLFTIQRYALNQ